MTTTFHLIPEVRKAAADFANKWADETREKQNAQSFWFDFLTKVIQVPDLRAAGIAFEHPCRTPRGTTGFIDALWPGVVLIEHKSAKKNLDEAEVQAREYLNELSRDEAAPFIIVSNFSHIRIVDVVLGTKHEFATAELPKHLEHILAVFSDYSARATRTEVAADREAVERMVELYKAFEAAGYEGHEVSVLLIRILFCVFADDTGLWSRPGAFEDIITAQPADGSTLGPVLNAVFAHLNDPKPPANTPDYLTALRYTNGGLFAENIRPFHFTRQMREALLAVCSYSWADISPAIFGAMFQTVKSKEDRRKLGEHYTSEANIMKVLRPLFLDEFEARMRKAWHSAAQLRSLRVELAAKRFLDPACGAGNFLIVAFRELRELELKLIVRIQEVTGTTDAVALDGLGSEANLVSVTQFHGIEWEEWSSRIATVAMFMASRQADIRQEEVTGSSPASLPIRKTAHIHHGSALDIVWSDIVTMDGDTYIFGNPPYLGAKRLNTEQRKEHHAVWKGVKASGDLDFVASWFLLAAKALQGTTGKAAFVSTNSVTQGPQAAVVWGELSKVGFGIDFAHRSFRWQNSGGAEAAVSVIIVGFSQNPKPAKRSLWSYDEKGLNGVEKKVSRINAYLLDAPEVLVTARAKPLQGDTEELLLGSNATDGGHLSNIKPEEAAVIRATDPVAAKYLRRVLGAAELTSGKERYGLWLNNTEPHEIRQSAVLRQRVAAVRAMREASPDRAAQKGAARANEWLAPRHREEQFIAVPLITTASRRYIPMALMDGEDVVANHKVSAIYGGSTYAFGILSSRAFVLWTHAVSGRLGDAPNIGNTITYNNFAFPEGDKEAIAVAAEKVLEVRKGYPTSSLADLYDDLSMPADLRKAHKALDAAVVKAYGLPAGTSEEALLEHLFSRYAELTEAKQAA